MKGRKVLVGVLLAALVAGLSGNGCSELHKPTAPVHPPHFTPSYALPESCLRYMQLGIERKDDVGMGAYLEALADSAADGLGFHAFFDPAVWNAYGGVRPEDWDVPHEALFLIVFFSSYMDPYEMRWLPDEVHPYDELNAEGDRMVLHRRYEIRVLRQSPPDTLLIAVGYADLHFARISASRWALYRWQDRVAPDVGFPPADPDQQTLGYRRLNAGAGG